jgi:predicted SprT family Zn-dependent metalloprotease
MLKKEFAVFANDAKFKNTVLHEIAHAIAGPEAGHGSQWKRIAHQIGYDRNFKRCHPTTDEDLLSSFKNKGNGKKQSNVHVARNIKMNMNKNKNKNKNKNNKAIK